MVNKQAVLEVWANVIIMIRASGVRKNQHHYKINHDPTVDGYQSMAARSFSDVLFQRTPGVTSTLHTTS